MASNSKWNFFLNIFYLPSALVSVLIQKTRLQQRIIFKWRRWDDIQILFCLQFMYFFVTSIFLQGHSNWWVWHFYCTILLYCKRFPNLKINYKKLFAFMLKFHAIALLIHFMNRFCCRLWASRLINIFPLMKKCIIFKGNIKESDISRKIKFCQIRNLWGFDLKKYLPRKFPGEH